MRQRGSRDYCTELCATVASELTRAQRVCQATGDTELWTSAIALSDALSELFRNDKRLWLAARDVGITREQWAAIKTGETA